jgi:hypothetical protein
MDGSRTIILLGLIRTRGRKGSSCATSEERERAGDR